MERRVAIMQPYLFPYLGYFQLIHSCNVFAFYDNIRWIKNGWINRNKIWSDHKETWLTIPTEKIHLTDRINEVKIANSDFKKDLLNKVKMAYGKAPNADLVLDLVNGLRTDTEYVVEVVESNLVWLIHLLGLNRSTVSTVNIHSIAADAEYRVIDICKQLGGKTYINMIGGQGLYDKENFKYNGVNLKFLTPNTPCYREETLKPTRSNYSVPGHLSILDALAYLDIEDVKRRIADYDLE